MTEPLTRDHCEGYLGIENRHVCMTCDVPWPCEVAILRAKLAQVTAERDEAREDRKEDCRVADIRFYEIKDPTQQLAEAQARIRELEGT